MTNANSPASWRTVLPMIKKGDFLIMQFGHNDAGTPKTNSDDLTNHTAYIQSWLQALENDPKFIFRASASASKAADFILSFSRPKEDVGAEEQTETAAA